MSFSVAKSTIWIAVLLCFAPLSAVVRNCDCAPLQEALAHELVDSIQRETSNNLLAAPTRGEFQRLSKAGSYQSSPKTGDVSTDVTRGGQPAEHEVITNYRTVGQNATSKALDSERVIPDAASTYGATQSGAAYTTSKLPGSLDSAGRFTVSQAIDPALSAALSAEKNDERVEKLKRDLRKVEYRSSPLRGTEARDREALGLSPSSKRTLGILGGLEKRSPTRTGGGGAEEQSPIHGEFAAAFQARYALGNPNAQNVLESSAVQTEHNDVTRAGSSQIGVAVVSSPTPSVAASPGVAASQRQTQDAGTPGRQIVKATAKMWQGILSRLKNKISSLSSPLPESPSPTPSGAYEGDGYSEEDVQKLVNDIIRQIQMRKDEVHAHGEMLEQTNRWSPNNVTMREEKTEGRAGPMLYMRTKVLVAPETVMEAVMTSARRMLMSRRQPMSWMNTSKLLTEVQTRLSEVLTPVDD